MHIITTEFKSKILFMPTTVSIIMPERVGKHRVLWLLHGANSNNNEWLYNSALCSIFRDSDTMVVMPSALNSDYGYYPDFANGYNFPGFFFEELMPWIFGQLGGSERREDNYIAGASMGAYGALELGLMHPERFAGIASFGGSLRDSEFLEPYKNMTGEEFRKYATEHRTDFPTEYGSKEWGIKPKEINVIAKYPTVKDFLEGPECMFNRFPEVVRAGILPEIFMLVGTEDLFYEHNVRFKELAGSLGVDNITYEFIRGEGHNPALWSKGLELIAEKWRL